MCNLTTPLKMAEIPVYAVSTWLVRLGKLYLIADAWSHRNTDYVLVPKAEAERAVEILTADGWYFNHTATRC